MMGLYQHAHGGMGIIFIGAGVYRDGNSVTMETAKPQSVSALLYGGSVAVPTERKMDAQTPLTAVYIQAVPAPPPPQQLFPQAQFPVTPPREPVALHLPVSPLYTKDTLPFLTVHFAGRLQPLRPDSSLDSQVEEESGSLEEDVFTLPKYHCGEKPMTDPERGLAGDPVQGNIDLSSATQKTEPRQQATQFFQEWEGSASRGKPQSYESTDSGFSESTDHNMEPLPECITEHREGPGGSQAVTAGLSQKGPDSRDSVSVREQRSLEEHISKLISDNSVVVEDKQLENMRPRKTMLSKQGSIDLPMPYTYKDSFHFDMRNNPTSITRLHGNTGNRPVLQSSLQPPHSVSTEQAPLTRSSSLPYSVALLTPEQSNQSFSCRSDYVTLIPRGSSGPVNPTAFSGQSVDQQVSAHRPLVRQAAVDCNHATEGLLFANSLSLERPPMNNDLSCEGGGGGDTCGEPSDRKRPRKKAQKFTYNKWYAYKGGTFKKLYNTTKGGDSMTAAAKEPSPSSMEHSAAQIPDPPFQMLPFNPGQLNPVQKVFHVQTADLQICLQIISDEQLALFEPRMEKQATTSDSRRKTQAQELYSSVNIAGASENLVHQSMAERPGRYLSETGRGPGPGQTPSTSSPTLETVPRQNPDNNTKLCNASGEVNTDPSVAAGLTVMTWWTLSRATQTRACSRSDVVTRACAARMCLWSTQRLHTTQLSGTLTAGHSPWGRHMEGSPARGLQRARGGPPGSQTALGRVKHRGTRDPGRINNEVGENAQVEAPAVPGPPVLPRSQTQRGMSAGPAAVAAAVGAGPADGTSLSRLTPAGGEVVLPRLSGVDLSGRQRVCDRLQVSCTEVRHQPQGCLRQTNDHEDHVCHSDTKPRHAHADATKSQDVTSEPAGARPAACTRDTASTVTIHTTTATCSSDAPVSCSPPWCCPTTQRLEALKSAMKTCPCPPHLPETPRPALPTQDPNNSNSSSAWKEDEVHISMSCTELSSTAEVEGGGETQAHTAFCGDPVGGEGEGFPSSSSSSSSRYQYHPEEEVVVEEKEEEEVVLTEAQLGGQQFTTEGSSTTNVGPMLPNCQGYQEGSSSDDDDEGKLIIELKDGNLRREVDIAKLSTSPSPSPFPRSRKDSHVGPHVDAGAPGTGGSGPSRRRAKRCTCYTYKDKECVYYCHLDIIWINTPEHTVPYGLWGYEGTRRLRRCARTRRSGERGAERQRCVCALRSDATCNRFCAMNR
ncbi:hypothetical protein CRUP_031932 [Coryphaenoides rupestris]|nr:hypothetical protein CRUP_031932 [Coryphaenoides rupestris]